MTRSKKSNRAITITTPSTMVTRVPVAAPAVVVTSVAKKRKKKGKKRRKTGIGGVPMGEVERAWIMSLNDPFENIPLPIGLGNMYPAEVVTAYIRGSFQSNATDGSFQIWNSPMQFSCNSATTGGFINIDTQASATTPTFSVANSTASNAGTLQNSYDQFRVLSGGLRVINSGSWSGASGIMSSCVYPQDATGSIRNGTSQTPVATGVLSNYPQMDWTRGYDPLQVLWRPVELTTLGQFLSMTATVTGNQAGLAPALVVCGNGGTPGATIYYEAIAHLEVYNVSKGVVGGSMAHRPGLTASAETMGGAYQSVLQFLEPATQSIVEWSKEAAHTLGQSALAGGLAYAQRRLFRSRGDGFLGSSPFEMIELKSNR